MDFHLSLIKQGVKPIIAHNPRNTKKPLKIKYRIQQFDKGVSTKKLDKQYEERAEAEQACSTMKEHFGVKKIYVKDGPK